MITCPIDVSTIFQTEDRTYSFRRRTMEATIDSTTKKPPVTPAAEGKLKCETLLLFFFSLSRIITFFFNPLRFCCVKKRCLLKYQ